MSENKDKYLAQMLEGCESNLPQIEQAIAGMEDQLSQMKDQRQVMVESASELREILGLTEEAAAPNLKIVSDEE